MANARRQALESPWLGAYLAQIELPGERSGRFRWERTIVNNPGHHTLWGDPDELLRLVVEIVPV